MHTAADAFLLVYAGLFPVVNPLGTAPIFLALTTQHSRRVRHSLARRVAINGFVLLLVSLFVGSYVLVFFGITIPVLRIAGGAVVAAVGWRILRDGVEPSNNPSDAEKAGPIDAFYPLTMPLTVGPGSISVAIALGSQRPRAIEDFETGMIVGIAAIAALAAVAATVFVFYRFADRTVAVLGASGIRALVSLSAFILLCIGIQIGWSGYSQLAGIANP